MSRFLVSFHKCLPTFVTNCFFVIFFLLHSKYLSISKSHLYVSIILHIIRSFNSSASYELRLALNPDTLSPNNTWLFISRSIEIISPHTASLSILLSNIQPLSVSLYSSFKMFLYNRTFFNNIPPQFLFCCISF